MCLSRIVALTNHAMPIEDINRHPQQTLLQRDTELGTPDTLPAHVPDLAFVEQPQARVSLGALNARAPDEIVALVRIRQEILLGHEEPETRYSTEEKEGARQAQGGNPMGSDGDGLMVFIQGAEGQD